MPAKYRWPPSKMSEIPRRKPRWYPADPCSGAISRIFLCHIASRRVYGRKIETYAERTEHGRALVNASLRKKFPWAFTNTGYWEKRRARK